MKSDNLIEDIKSRLDIVDVISDYMELKKAGLNFKANCPFHSEKTPSFMVSQNKQIFHCFGCNAGGDIFGFVMKYENITFQEALKLLAKKAGIKLAEYKFEKDLSEKKDRLNAVQKEALDFYKKSLKESKKACEYLKSRNISNEMIDAFSLGYAHKEWRLLCNHLREKGFEESFIAQSGLVFSGEKGFYDIFRDRIIFPIFNIHGDPIAFGGRAMDNTMPKYLNTPETLLFKKSETLYGLNIARDEIRKKDYVMIVEGYFDVIMCRQHGFLNVVAPLGTALTSGHIKKISRFTKKMLLIFDNDAAGIAAAKRSIAAINEQGFKCKVLLLPEGDDPDSFLRKNNSRAFQARLAKAKSIVDFFLSLRGDRTDNIRAILSLISGTGDQILKEEFLKELSEKSGINESVLRKESVKIPFGQKKRIGAGTSADTASSGAGESLRYDEAVLLLSAIVSFPEKAPQIFENLNIEMLSASLVKEIFKKIRLFADKITMQKMLDVLSEEEKALITKLSLNPGFELEDVDINVRDCLKKTASRELDEKIKMAKNSDDRRLLNQLLAEKHRAKKIRREQDEGTV